MNAPVREAELLHDLAWWDEAWQAASWREAAAEYHAERSACIVPAKTSVLAYLDDNGDLWIHASDSALQCDTEFRIAGDDIGDFLNGLAELVGRPPVVEPTEPAKPKDPTATERKRRQRQHQRDINRDNRDNRDMSRAAAATVGATELNEGGVT
jgi:hypothetical protein